MAKEKEAKTSANHFEQLRNEYGVCIDTWRFFIGLRFTVLAFILTLSSGLLYVFLKGDVQTESLKCLLPVIGFLSVMAGLQIENRNRRLYYACLLRAKEIEKKFNYENNQAKKIERASIRDKLDLSQFTKENCIAIILDNCCPVTLLSWQSLGIWLIYFTFGITWIVLFFTAIPGLASKAISIPSSISESLEFWCNKLLSW